VHAVRRTVRACQEAISHALQQCGAGTAIGAQARRAPRSRSDVVRPHGATSCFGRAAATAVIAMGLGYAISIGDPTSLSANLQVVSAGVQISGATATFVPSLAARNAIAVGGR
jgi:hypothetical protein